MSGDTPTQSDVVALAPVAPGAVAPVAVTSRSGFDESLHHGVAVGLGGDGEVRVAIGDPQVAVYGRSANKPLQADAMLRCGLRLDTEGLALACASHDGTDAHLAVVRRVLAEHGLTEAALGNTPALPFDGDASAAWLRAGGEPDPLHQNCSGKHAAMLATCVTAGWPLDEYLDAGHPLQLAIADRIEQLAGPIAHIGIDGCGAPAHVVPLVSLARSFARLATEQGEVWAAMTTHPALVGGDARDVTRLMRAVPGVLAKDGAEGMLVAALPDGRAAAVKIADGSSRAAGVVLVGVLRQLGIEVPDAAVGDPILGHGRPVGDVRAL